MHALMCVVNSLKHFIPAVNDAEAQADSQSGSWDDGKFESVRDSIPPRASFGKFRMAPVDFEKVCVDDFSVCVKSYWTHLVSRGFCFRSRCLL